MAVTAAMRSGDQAAPGCGHAVQDVQDGAPGLGRYGITLFSIKKQVVDLRL